MVTKLKTNGDFTARERQIREALFAVFYEKDWRLEYRPPSPDRNDEAADIERWKFVDSVIDTLRSQQKQGKRAACV